MVWTKFAPDVTVRPQPQPVYSLTGRAWQNWPGFVRCSQEDMETHNVGMEGRRGLELRAAVHGQQSSMTYMTYDGTRLGSAENRLGASRGAWSTHLYEFWGTILLTG